MKLRKSGWNGRLLLLLLLCVMALAGACGKKKTAGSEDVGDTQGGFCKDVSIFKCLGDESYCDKGMIRIKDGIMYFHEYETGRSYPLCSNAYCKHEPYHSSMNPDPVCEATMEGLKYACIYGDNLYVVQEIGLQTLRVQVRNLKESGYRLVAELPYCACFSAWGYHAVRGDKAYLFLGEVKKEEEDGDAMSFTSNDLFTSLVELDLKTGKYKKLFCIEEGDKKYKVLRTVYDKEGIYMQWYYEDVFYDRETHTGGTNEYRDKFFYVSYDGTVKKELCREIGELTAYDKENPEPKGGVAGIGEQGVYYLLLGENILRCSYYEKEVQKVYEQPVEQGRMLYEGVSGNYLLVSASREDGSYFVTGTDLTTKEERRKEMEKMFAFLPLRDGVFVNFVSGDGENSMELWNYEDIFSEDRAPFFTYKE